MNVIAPTRDLPRPGDYIQYFDWTKKETTFLKLAGRRGPISYPYRMPEVAAGVKGNHVVFSELDPSEDKKHRYLAYLGLPKGFLFYLFHPYDVRINKLDSKIDLIEEDLVALDYGSSPYDHPTYSILVTRGRYPALQALNISGESKVPEVIWVVYTFKVAALAEREAFSLRTGQIPSILVEAGGETL